jgi:hypothetical protein
VNSVSGGVARFPLSSSKLVRAFRVLRLAHLSDVHHFGQFASLHLSNGSASAASFDALLFQQSRSNVIRGFGRSAMRHLENVHRFHRFAFHRHFSRYSVPTGGNRFSR